MLKYTSKESDFHADFIYIVSSNLVFVIKSYEPEKNYLILENREKHPIKVTEIGRASCRERVFRAV